MYLEERRLRAMCLTSTAPKRESCFRPAQSLIQLRVTTEGKGGEWVWASCRRGRRGWTLWVEFYKGRLGHGILDSGY